ncbi:serine/threonine-protein kinase [Micromonospora sp. NPDC051006]|uniref:serine/threonine-protein kinase n=1 Tax=Micromonospora sp. NPDC051006 TaxID=3364283 RepID=UPI0037B0E96A
MTAPSWIGPYRVERLLGAGSFATVWLGHDPVLDCRVAIKVLAENWSHDLRVRERFLDEARLLRRLEHERLVRVHAVGELPDGRPYAVLAWADGGSLRDRLARGPLPVPDALALLDQIAAGVAVLHRHDVVHRDLTPGNILFRSGPQAGSGPPGEHGSGPERVLIADLGLAKALAAASGLTARAGTPGYMAPEQDDPLAVVDTRADVFGLGRLGLRLLGAAAVPPDPPTPPSDRGPGAPVRLRYGVPPGVAAVLTRATAPRPGERYPDAAAFRAALAGALGGGSVRAAAAERRPVRRQTLTAGSDRVAAARRRPVRHRLATAGAGLLAFAALGLPAGDAGTRRHTAGTAASGPVTVALPAGWRATGTGWSGQYGDDGELEPALVISPEPARWAADPSVPGAFVGLSASTARRTTVEGWLAERPHADCVPQPVRRTRQGGIDWVVAGFTCPAGRPVIVEAAGLAAVSAGLLYVQVTPPPGRGADFVDTLLAGVRVG